MAEVTQSGASMAAGPSAASVPAEAKEWFCKNCGHINPPDALDCERCTFPRDYDPEAKAQVDFTAVQATIEQEEHKRRLRVSFYLELVKNALLLVLVVVFLIIGFRLMRNWPFEGAYDRDAGKLVDAVLTVKSNVDRGVTKAGYDNLVIPVMVEAEKFRIKYGESRERQRDSFQMLYQAAEYYGMAADAWQNQLTTDNTMPANPGALSINANEQVKQLWEKAANNATRALEDLR